MYNKGALMGHAGENVALRTYLDVCAAGDHILSSLLREPNPGRGVVHTPREIVQQPFLWRETARRMKRLGPDLMTFLESAGLYDAADRAHVLLTGAGTSNFVGLSLIDLLRTRLRTSCSAFPTTRITAAPSLFFLPGQRLVLIHFARSGNSPESTNVLDVALQHHADSIRHVVITCNEKGELARRARAHPEQVFLIVLDQACNDRGLAMTSSFSNMVVAGQAIAHLDDIEWFNSLIERTAKAAEHLIATYADEIYELAEPGVARVFYLGNGDLFGAAAESALKVQELSVGQVIAIGEDPLSFRHGPISAVDGNTMVVFLLSEDPYTRRYELDVLLQYQEAFKEIGARVVVLGSSVAVPGLDSSITVLEYDPHGAWSVPPLYQVNIATLFGQLFGLLASYKRNLNVDDPSVAKEFYSRTVQGVRIYEYRDGQTGDGHALGGHVGDGHAADGPA